MSYQCAECKVLFNPDGSPVEPGARIATIVTYCDPCSAKLRARDQTQLLENQPMTDIPPHTISGEFMGDSTRPRPVLDREGKPIVNSVGDTIPLERFGSGEAQPVQIVGGKADSRLFVSVKPIPEEFQEEGGPTRFILVQILADQHNPGAAMGFTNEGVQELYRQLMNTVPMEPQKRQVTVDVTSMRNKVWRTKAVDWDGHAAYNSEEFRAFAIRWLHFDPQTRSDYVRALRGLNLVEGESPTYTLECLARPSKEQEPIPASEQN